MFGVFYYRSANARTLETLRQFLPVPVERAAAGVRGRRDSRFDLRAIDPRAHRVGRPALLRQQSAGLAGGRDAGTDSWSWSATSPQWAAFLDSIPFSGIIRIRDMMYTVKDPFRLDQGDVSFDAPDTVKNAMHRAIDENRSHYLQTTGLPRLLELLADKLRRKNGIPVGSPDEIMVTTGGIHGGYITCQALLEPGDEVIVPGSGVAAVCGQHQARARRRGAVPAPRVDSAGATTSASSSRRSRRRPARSI